MGTFLQIFNSVLLLLGLVPASYPYSGQMSMKGAGPSWLSDPDNMAKFNRRDQICSEVPSRQLRQILGSPYEGYYMSFKPPKGFTLQKRSNNYDEDVMNRPFYFEEDTQIVLSEEPAWSVDPSAVDYLLRPERNFSTLDRRGRMLAQRHKRQIPSIVVDALAFSGNVHFKWICDAPKKWIDLGKGFFPRYMLSVDCNHPNCQGDRFQCKPLSFGVRLLRRRDGVCAPWFQMHKDTLQIDSEQLPDDLKESWVWEVRAIHFCCVCQLK